MTALRPPPAGSAAASVLTAGRRTRDLEEALDGREVDVLVVGLGVTGAGVALDAAARGLSVVAVDAHDLAFGTSRWSSKLVHGGLRYLAHGQVGVAYESAVERHVLMTRIAPHLVHALPMVLPLTPAVPARQAALTYAGLLAGDVLRVGASTPRAVLPRARRLGRTETTALTSGLQTTGLRGGLLSWDGQLEDDARLVVALARTAASYGARILTHTRVTALDGRGADLRDELTGDTGRLRARTVVNATGVWAAGLVDGISLRPSRGTHLVLRGSPWGLRTAVTVPVPGSLSRFVFALPQADGLVYVGLTDVPADGPVPDIPEPTEEEIGFLLATVGTALDPAPTRTDVVGAYAGLRPLLDAEGGTADLSRRHAVLTSSDGVVTVVGGKLTTYRRMAEDTVDAVVAAGGLAAAPCRTGRMPLLGAGTGAGPTAALPARLVRRYGAEAATVLASARQVTGLPAEMLLAPAVAGPPEVPVTRAELLWGATHEGAVDVGDLLDRRTRVGLVPSDRAAVEPLAAWALEAAAATGPST